MQLASEGEVVGVDGERGDVQLDLGPHGHTCSRGVISDTRTVRFSAAIVGAAVGREQPHAVHLAVVLLLTLRQAEELLRPVARHLVAEDGDVPPSKEDRVFTVALAGTFLLDILAGGEAAEFLGTLPLLGRLHAPHHLLLAVPLAYLPTVRVQAVDPSCLLSLTTAPLPDALAPGPRAPEMGGGTRGKLATAHVGRLLRSVATSYRGNLWVDPSKDVDSVARDAASLNSVSTRVRARGPITSHPPEWARLPVALFHRWWPFLPLAEGVSNNRHVWRHQVYALYHSSLLTRTTGLAAGSPLGHLPKESSPPHAPAGLWVAPSAIFWPLS